MDRQAVCKICNKSKRKRTIRRGLNKYSYVDDSGNAWSGKICYECTLKPWIDAKCIECSSIFKTKSKKSIYCSDECRISGLRSYYRNWYESHKVLMGRIPNVDRVCLTCFKDFEGHTGSKYCSDKCRPPKKTTKNKYNKVDHRNRNCLNCNTPFKPTRDDKYYCKRSCTPSYKKDKAFRRSIRRCKHQKISQYYKKDIQQIYLNRPDGDYHVDHIIPLKGENICGLHVPWNLQYLQGPENIIKSNTLFTITTLKL